jgi:integrase
VVPRRHDPWFEEAAGSLAYGWTALTSTCHEQFRRINLHWHDLRHEYASRLVEHGVPLSQVRDLLGHASIVTTERYDNQQLERLQVAAGKLESGKLFEAPPGESGTEFHIPCTTGPTTEAAGSPAGNDDRR